MCTIFKNMSEDNLNLIIYSYARFMNNASNLLIDANVMKAC